MDKIKSLCKRSYPKHNWEGHLIPVVNRALRLNDKYGGDRQIIEAAAYLHDIGRVLFPYLQIIGITHEVSGYYYSRTKLSQYRCQPIEKEYIAKCVLEHSGSGNSKNIPTSLESEIVMNADGLAALDFYFYQFAIYYASHRRDIGKTIDWTKKKIDGSMKKITLPGLKEESEGLYNKIHDELMYYSSICSIANKLNRQIT